MGQKGQKWLGQVYAILNTKIQQLKNKYIKTVMGIFKSKNMIKTNDWYNST